MGGQRFLNDNLSAPPFARDYDRCREKFLAAAERAQMALQHIPLGGNDGLYCDVGWSGDRDASNVLVLISGTHGVEGYCGSAVQSYLLGCLNESPEHPADNSAVLMVHALNPWGMVHARRCDQDGIDLNRNFINFDSLPEVESGYDHCLQRICSAPFGHRSGVIAALSVELGTSWFERVFSGGQYHCDWGPFYGGRKPAWSSQTVDTIIDQYRLEGRNIVVIDLHSGLGPWAFGELISDHPSGSQGDRYARSLFGPAIAAVDSGGSFSVPKTGLMDYRWHRLMSESGCFLTLEFGSYGSSALFEVLLEDHLIHRHKNSASSVIHDQRLKMVEHFCPAQSLWQQAALFKAMQVVWRILESFRND